MGHRKPGLVSAAYRSVLDLARSHTVIGTIAYPATSTGVYGFPIQEAAGIAFEEMRRAEADFERIVACLFDDPSAEVLPPDHGRTLSHRSHRSTPP